MEYPQSVGRDDFHCRPPLAWNEGSPPFNKVMRNWNGFLSYNLYIKYTNPVRNFCKQKLRPLPEFPGVLCNVLGVLHNILGVLTNVLGMLRKMVGVLRNILGVLRNIRSVLHNVLGVLHNVLCVLRNILRVLRNILGVLHNVLGVLRTHDI